LSVLMCLLFVSQMDYWFFFSSRSRHTRSDRDWSSDVCSSDLQVGRLRADLMAARIAALAGSADASGGLLTLAAEARPVFETAGDDTALTEAWIGTAWGQLVRCQYAAMLEAVERAIDHASRAGYTRWERELPVWWGTALFYGPTPV